MSCFRYILHTLHRKGKKFAQRMQCESNCKVQINCKDIDLNYCISYVSVWLAVHKQFKSTSAFSHFNLTKGEKLWKFLDSLNLTFCKRAKPASLSVESNCFAPGFPLGLSFGSWRHFGGILLVWHRSQRPRASYQSQSHSKCWLKYFFTEWMKNVVLSYGSH